ncbi:MULTISPECIES: glycosyltransferase [unclassified Acinetobacter]|uniref:glycosyltransferase n=1 Tax=unclassified Acinetobacter TaxID=196816 RepID=UPI002934A0A1|nr:MULTISPECIES: glycosyltransferase [unclassified Acinetobacter]WOE30887.1 glycosyltransferase [Acinetobacter sp. SAAs470]WOE39082.1 glycosyltransferase [Acinetobacter sp. SAAs474]
MSNKPVLVHVITNFAGIGGAEMMLSRLITATEDQYQHVIIALMNISDVYAQTLARCQAYYALHWNGLNTVKVLYQLRQLLKQLAPQTVQCWMYHANVMTSLSVLGLRQKPAVVWGIHHSLAAPQQESISTKLALYLSRLLTTQCHAIIYCAHSALTQHQDFGLQHTQAHVIANGINLDQFQPHMALQQPCVIGFAGNYRPAKGYDYLFATIAQLKDQPIVFKIAGQGADLNHPEIRHYFEQYQLSEGQVQLCGQVSDMPAFYQSVDVFLMTSITEGFPNVLVEAMASGLPCISTDVGDAAYIVQNIGEIVAPRDVQGLVQAILNYLQLSTSEKLQLKQAARQRVTGHFSIESVSQQYLDVWSKSQ